MASAPNGASYGDGVRRPSEAGRAPLRVPRRGEAPAPRKRLRGGTARPWPPAAAGKQPAVKADGSLGAWARPFLSPRPLPRLRSWTSGARGFALCLASGREGDVPLNRGDGVRLYYLFLTVCLQKPEALSEMNFFWLLSNLLTL